MNNYPKSRVTSLESRVSSHDRFIALDYGTRKTGIAYSVESFAFSWKTVPTASLFDVLPKYIQEKQTEAIIIGMPYNIDGTMSKHGRRVERFAKECEEKLGLPVIFHDERLTTSEAKIGFEQYSTSGDIDAEAARLILASYLESQ